MSLWRSVLTNSLFSTQSKCLLQGMRCASYFSVARERIGKSTTELKKEQQVIAPTPVEVPNCRRDVRINPKKMLAVANLVSRMPIDEAIVQCQFSPKGAAVVVKEVLEEAQKMAVEQYGVEDKSHLFVDQSHVGRGQHLRRIKFHGRGRFGRMKRYYCHYFCVLKEGVPPGKDIKRDKGRHLPELERKLRYPKTIKNSLAWW